MICEGAQTRIETSIPEKEVCKSNKKQVKTLRKERSELESFKAPKNWKKTISNFFRNPLRSTKSNENRIYKRRSTRGDIQQEGDRHSGSDEDFNDQFINPEQKWQSLGKMFRRPSYIDHWNKNVQQGESSARGKRLGIKKALSSYFVKSSKFNENSKSVADNNDS